MSGTNWSTPPKIRPGWTPSSPGSFGPGPNEIEEPKSAKWALCWAAAGSVLLMILPGLSFLALPLQYLNTHVHEFCHAFAALATGGQAHLIHVYASGSGRALTSGGMFLAIVSAGYVGTAAVGAAMIALSRNVSGARLAMGLLGGLVGVSVLLWVRADVVGVVGGLFWSGLLLYLANRMRGVGSLVAAQFLGVQLCLTTLQSFLVLFQVIGFAGIENDATIAYRATGIPAVVWAGIWSLIGLGLMALALRYAWMARPIAPTVRRARAR
ncbi:MAG: M50 family metallopeptidase [Fimbriimonadaceae bacterium]